MAVSPPSTALLPSLSHLHRITVIRTPFRMSYNHVPAAKIAEHTDGNVTCMCPASAAWQSWPPSEMPLSNRDRDGLNGCEGWAEQIFAICGIPRARSLWLGFAPQNARSSLITGDQHPRHHSHPLTVVAMVSFGNALVNTRDLLEHALDRIAGIRHGDYHARLLFPGFPVLNSDNNGHRHMLRILRNPSPQFLRKSCSDYNAQFALWAWNVFPAASSATQWLRSGPLRSGRASR